MAFTTLLLEISGAKKNGSTRRTFSTAKLCGHFQIGFSSHGGGILCTAEGTGRSARALLVSVAEAAPGVAAPVAVRVVLHALVLVIQRATRVVARVHALLVEVAPGAAAVAVASGVGVEHPTHRLGDVHALV